MAEYFGVSVEELRKVAKPCFDLEYAAWHISYEAMWDVLCKAFGKDLPYNHRDIVVNRMHKATLRHSVVTMIQTIKQFGFHAYLLSDMTKEWKDQFVQKGWYEVFEDCVHSCDVGMTKAKDAYDGTTHIFDYALDRFGLQSYEAVFVDDKKENILSASRAGMYVIQALNEQQIVSDVLSFLDL